MTEDDFLRAIAEDPPSAATTWLVLADWLEERGDSRAELVRLLHDPGFRPDLAGPGRDEQVRALLAGGVQPVVPSLVNGVGMYFVLVPAGTFLMGSDDEESRRAGEGPRHEVEITRPFWLGACPVTQEEYQRVMGTNPSYFSAAGGGKGAVRGLDTSRFPVEMVSWEDATAFCAKLSALQGERAAGRAYRLPTEAEWEYACRAGAADGAPFHVGWALSSSQANFNGNNPAGGAAVGPALGRPAAVGSYPPNAWGLYDLHGNVWEWCADWDGEYRPGRQRDPRGPKRGTARVLRGGSWCDNGLVCHAAFRLWGAPSDRRRDVGCRVCSSAA
jgi:uncharacterized protein (TIGR02996 family)